MPGKIRKAMVLAAGYGTRLKPLTDHTPKPLVPVAGKPMIDYALEKLITYGIEEVVINVSYLKEPLMRYLAGFNRLKVTLSEEPEPLETGGGLAKALPLLGAEPFFTINSDIIWTDSAESALDRLNATWDEAKMDVLLLAQSKTTAVGHDKGEDHLFVKRETTLGWSDSEAPYIIAGVGIIHPRLFANAPSGKFSVKVLWLEALRNNRLFCLPHQGKWFQAGTLPDLKRTEERFGKR
ncbi:MAG TPA: nucleotidyltransferase family protein [Candidatus Paceibacterota bacterium]|nr:nucleotidyltransferase family protein [Candidatus Paceibacterota bacterium]